MQHRGRRRLRSVELPVRSRRTLSGDQPPTTALSVSCPRRGASIATDDCFDCPSFAGAAAAEGGAVIVCATAQRPPSPTTLLRHAPTAETTRLSELMTRHVVCVREDLGVAALLALLAAEAFSGVPVVDPQGRLVGMVTRADAIRVRADQRVVGDIMTPVPFSVPEHATLDVAAEVMTCADIHRVPVVDDQARVVGIVSALDIVRWVAAAGDAARR